jgi:hypothetical protein
MQRATALPVYILSMKSVETVETVETTAGNKWFACLHLCLHLAERW